MTTALFEASLLHEIEQLKRRMYQLEHRRSLTYASDGSVNFPDGISIGDSAPIFVDEDVPAPTGLTLSKGTLFERIFIDVSWTAPTGSGSDQVVEYEVKLTETEFGVSQYVRTAGTATRFEGLKPEKAYSVEVRALNRLGKSSAVLGPSSITTDKDASVPGKVTNVIATAGAKSITARWDARTEPDMTNGKGLYEVEIATNSGFTTGLRSQRTSATIASWTDLVTGQQYWVRVRAIDSSGNFGAYSDTTAQSTATPGKITNADATTSSGAITDSTVPASSPTPTVTGGPGYLYASWTPIGNNDPVTYEVHMSTTSGFTPAAGTKVGETSGSFFFIRRTAAGGALANATTYYVKILSKDADGPATAASAEGSGQLAPVGDADLSGTAPSVPTSLSATPGVIANTSEGFIDFSWTQSGTVGSWEVRYKRSGETNYSYLVTATNGVRLRALLPGTTYNVSVRAISKVGAASAFATDVNPAVPGDTSAPGTVANVVAGAGLRTVTARWDDVAIPDLDYYEAQIATNSGFTTGVVTIRTKGTIVSFGDRAAQTDYWVRVLAVDTSGNKSGGGAGTYTTASPAPVKTAAVADADVSVGTLNGDRIVSNSIDALQIKANAVQADELAAINLAVGKYIRSNVYTAGSAGWSIDADGNAEFNQVVVRGTIGTGNVSGMLDVGASQVQIDGPNRVITIRDAQATPVVRVSLGKLSTGTTDYGLIVRDAAGNVMFSATDQGVSQYGIKTDAVVSGKINADAVGAREIAAAAITTEHLTVAAANPSMALNGSFEDTKESDVTKPAEWIQGTTSTGSTWTRHTTAANVHSGQASLALAVTGTTSEQSVDSETLFPVVGGEYYELSAHVKSSVASADGFYLRVYWYKADGTAASTASLDAASNVATTTAFAKHAAILQAPADAARAKIRIYNYQPATVCTMYVDSVEIRRAVSSTTITPNAITTGMIQTLQINSDHIVTAGLDAGKILFGTMQGDRISANTLDADRIKTSEIESSIITIRGTGMLRIGRATTPFHYMTQDDSGLKFYRHGSAAFTGGFLAAEFNVGTGSTGITLTEAANNSGNRVELSPTGLRLYGPNLSGGTELKVNLATSDGSAYFKGRADIVQGATVTGGMIVDSLKTKAAASSGVVIDQTGLSIFNEAATQPLGVKEAAISTSTGGTSLSVTRPASATAGDLLVACIHKPDVGTFNAPSGWTFHNEFTGTNPGGGTDPDTTQRIYTRIMQSGDPSSWTWSFSASQSFINAIMVAVSGAHQTTPIQKVDGAYGPEFGLEAPAVTFSQAGALGLAFAGGGNDDTGDPEFGGTSMSAPTGYTWVAGSENGYTSIGAAQKALSGLSEGSTFWPLEGGARGYQWTAGAAHIVVIQPGAAAPRKYKIGNDGEILLEDVSVAPATNPTTGVKLYPQNGVLKTRNATGKVVQLGDWQPIQEVILGSNASQVDFTSIPQTYRNLAVRINARSTRVEQYDDIIMRFNGITGANYVGTRLIVTNSTGITNDGVLTFLFVGLITGANAFGGRSGSVWLEISDYAGIQFQKQVRSVSGMWNDNAYGSMRFLNGLLGDGQAVTSLTFTSHVGAQFIAGSRFTLYGLGAP